MTRGTVWFTGLSGAGKSTVAATLKQMLDDLGVPAILLDGDDLREGLNADLGFNEEHRRENVRRVGEVAMLFAKAERLALVTVISPFADGRRAVRARHREMGIPFVEIYVATPLEVCEERDPKGLYARARRGEVARFTGISSPYEVPEHPELSVQTVDRSPAESAKEVLALLETERLLLGPQ
ncbi:MAG TPA: adenylyl-sulfate kinase [Acidimicrobiales bacterium]|nr:adenylyl-sulfate kinase [Acidimicrobiales bacterium]